jgi:SAM-dependent methyltransferase
MDTETIAYLNDINRRFYRVTAASFDETRQQAWPGWSQLLPYLADNTPLSVLDVGCGNGRFGIYLAESFNRSIDYHGIDNNETLLAQAQEAVRPHANITATFEQRDVVFTPPDTGSYDLVVAFGLLHHIPGNTVRRRFLQALAERVANAGWLAFACWCFYEFDRFRKRITPWPQTWAERIERHDYLLDWRRGETALRYCHYVDDDEHRKLVIATGMQHTATYRADGFTGTLNRYSVLQRIQSI